MKSNAVIGGASSTTWVVLADDAGLKRSRVIFTHNCTNEVGRSGTTTMFSEFRSELRDLIACGRKV
jgi:hypothetical protein